METKKIYVLPELKYEYGALEPFLSEELMRLHHDKHHAAYVKGANAILEKMDAAKAGNLEFDAKATHSRKFPSI